MPENPFASPAHRSSSATPPPVPEQTVAPEAPARAGVSSEEALRVLRRLLPDDPAARRRALTEALTVATRDEG